MQDFLTAINSGQTLIFDGAMGSLLSARGASDGDSHVNLLHGPAVRDIHRQYLKAGADCLIANTLTLNAVYMAKRNRLSLLAEALTAGAEHALDAADGKAYVFGDIGPGGDLLAPYGAGDPHAYYEAFCGQAAIFAGLPLSGIIIETVFSLTEAELILRACRDAAPKLPVICSLTFTNTKAGGRTMMGDKAIDIALKARELGACAVGANCGDLTPAEFAVIMEAMRPAGLPLIAQPNAGKPSLSGGKVTYSLPPAQFAGEMITTGAQLMGGCCGTTPEHIRALKEKTAAF